MGIETVTTGASAAPAGGDAGTTEASRGTSVHPTTTAAPHTTTTSGGATATDFANLTYASDSCGSLYGSPPAAGFALRDGTVTHGTPAQPDFYSVSLRPKLAHGDLDGDGHADTALILDCSTGSSPQPYGWVFSGANPTHPARLGPIAFDAATLDRMGGRSADLTAVSISGDQLVTDWVVFVGDDPRCCPSKTARLTQRWDGHGFTTSTSG
jgi:hypothetical protein